MEFGDLVSFLCRFLIPRNCSHSAENYISATHRIKYQNILNIKISYVFNTNIYINYPEGWMALHTRTKAVHFGWSSSELVMLISKELMMRTSMKLLSIPKQCVCVVICPDWQYCCFFLVRKLTVQSMSA